MLAAAVDVVLLLCVYGTYVPGGLFLPSILIGALWGGAFGTFIETYISDTVQPSAMVRTCSVWCPSEWLQAIMGAVAVLNGVQRSTVSITIIIVEGTGKATSHSSKLD